MSDMSASIKHCNNEVHSTWANAHSGTVALLRVMLGHGHQNTWQKPNGSHMERFKRFGTDYANIWNFSRKVE